MKYLDTYKSATAVSSNHVLRWGEGMAAKVVANTRSPHGLGLWRGRRAGGRLLSEVQINKVYLQISTEQDNGYLGILPFETADRAKAVFNFLFIHIHDTLEAIGLFMDRFRFASCRLTS